MGRGVGRMGRGLGGESSTHVALWESLAGSEHPSSTTLSSSSALAQPQGRLSPPCQLCNATCWGWDTFGGVERNTSRRDGLGKGHRVSLSPIQHHGVCPSCPHPAQDVLQRTLRSALSCTDP